MSADQLHDLLMEATSGANERKELIAGAKIDLEKRFDAIRLAQAICVWDEWGAEPRVTRLPCGSYTKQSREKHRCDREGTHTQ